MKKSIETPLLLNTKQSQDEDKEKIRWEKMKKVASMAAPMVAVNMTDNGEAYIIALKTQDTIPTLIVR